MMRKILCVVCVMACVLTSSAFSKITYIDAELGNTTIGGAAPSAGVNYSTDYSAVEGLWGWRTNRTDVNGAGIWVTDGGLDTVNYDREDTAPLKVDVTLPNAGVGYNLYAIIMNNGSGSGSWDVAARIGDSGDFAIYNRNSEEMTQALASDFEGDVIVDGGGDMTMKVLIGRYTTTTDNETVSIYINGLDSWGQYNVDQRTRFDGVGYDVAPPFAVSPFDGETGVAVDNVTLTWAGGQDPNAVGHYVYLGTSPDVLTCLNPDSSLPVNTGTYSVGTLEMNTTYYWQVEMSMENGRGGYSAGDPNNIVSPVWSFTTIFSIPVITDQPADQAVSVGGTAEFTVGVDSLTTPTFAWYYSTDNATDTLADDILLSTDQTLTVTDVALTDEGYYYCVVKNDSDTEVPTATAKLAIAQLLAHWTLDQADYVNGQYLDVSGEGHHADPNGTPSFVAGQLGEGINILRADGAAEPATESWARAGTWNPSELSGMLTVSFWLKWAGQNTADSEQVIVSKRSSDNLGDATQWQITRPGSNSNKDLWFQSSNANIQVSNVLTQGEWQQVTVTFDGTTGVMYNNGVAVGSGAFQLGSTEAAANAMINLGGSNFDNNASRWMNGVMDDVKIYNYALSDLEAAQMYTTDNPGSSVCVQSLKPDASLDLNGDCIVNLGDFAMLAASWLDCGLVPDCE